MAPIEITLYGPDDQPGKTYGKRVVSWGLLKRAVRLSEEMQISQKPAAEIAPTDFGGRFKRWLHRNDHTPSGEEQMMNRIAEFVVDAFDGQFTLEQLEAGADVSEILNVLKSIVSRAQTMVPTNPPPRISSKVKHP